MREIMDDMWYDDSESGKYKETRREAERICREFRDALSSTDTTAARAALFSLRELVKDGEEELYLRPGDERMIREYSELLEVEESLEAGEEGRRTFSCFFSPYTGSPEDMLRVSSALSSPGETGMNLLLLETECFLEDLSGYSEELREAAYRYLEKWLMDLVDLIGAHIGELMSDPGENGRTGPVALAFLMSALISGRRFDGVTERAFSLFPLSIEEAGLKCPGPHSPLNNAVRAGNMKVFERLHASGKAGASVQSGKERPESVSAICCYPEESTEMLDRLFSLGLLIPGTEEGERAFFYTLMHWNLSRKILERVIHPSYFNSSSSLLTLAVQNWKFSPEGYDLLVRAGGEKESRELPPLYYAVESGDRRKTEALLSLGEDIFWHDRWGNNILHRLIASGRDTDFGEETEEYIHALWEETNIFGKRPADYERIPREMKTGRMESISFNEALGRVTALPGQRVLFSFCGRRYGSLRAVERAVGAFIDGEPGWVMAAADGAGFIDGIRRIKDMSDDGRRYLLIVHVNTPFREEAEPLPGELGKRDNVTLFFIATDDEENFRAAENIEEYDSVFVSRTSSSLTGEILTGREDTTALDSDTFLLKTGGEYLLVKAPFLEG